MSYNGAELNKGRVNTDVADFCTFFFLGVGEFWRPGGTHRLLSQDFRRGVGLAR